jgi:hypothetical protein
MSGIKRAKIAKKRVKEENENNKNESIKQQETCEKITNERNRAYPLWFIHSQ